ncbi:MAG TPA: glycosyltransferase family 4 protein, partial [Longimicrobiaceae bacterium]|nr:glycosyltransferase family 4 protein [Longimicrobiaceae bacterium]
AAEAAAAESAEGAGFNISGTAADAPRIGLDWQIGTNSGWGVYGFNLVRRALETRQGFPVLFTSPDLRSLDRQRLQKIEPALEVHRELARQAAKPGSTFNTRFPVLRALGNRLMGGSAGMSVNSPRNIGVIFFEDTRLDAEALERGRRYDRIIAGSTWNAEVLRANGIERVETCLQGIDPGLFRPGERTGRFGDRFVVFSGGKLEYRKGQDIVIAAFREFHARHPDSLLLTAWHNHWPATMAEIVLKGHVAGVPNVAGGRIDFGSWLEANGVPRDAFFDLGQLPHAEMAAAVREAHVGVFPNRCEGGTNLVAMECMAAGVPAVLSANTGHLDLIAEGACFPLRDQGPVPMSRQFLGTDGWGESSVDEIVEALESAYSNRDEAARRGHAGARLLADLSWDRQIDQLFGILADLLPTS